MSWFSTCGRRAEGPKGGRGAGALATGVKPSGSCDVRGSVCRRWQQEPGAPLVVVIGEVVTTRQAGPRGAGVRASSGDQKRAQTFEIDYSKI